MRKCEVKKSHRTLTENSSKVKVARLSNTLWAEEIKRVTIARWFNADLFIFKRRNWTFSSWYLFRKKQKRIANIVWTRLEFIQRTHSLVWGYLLCSYFSIIYDRNFRCHSNIRWHCNQQTLLLSSRSHSSRLKIIGIELFLSFSFFFFDWVESSLSFVLFLKCSNGTKNGIAWLKSSVAIKKTVDIFIS